MDICLSVVGLLIVLAIAWWLAKFVFKVAGCIMYGALMAVVTIGIAIILLVFVF